MQLNIRTTEPTEVAQPCELCAVLGRSAATRRRRPQTSTGLGPRITLVDDDPEVRLACEEMVVTQRAGWELQVHDPCRLACHEAVRKGPPPFDPELAPAQPSIHPDVVLLGLPDNDGSRLACVRKLKALAPELSVLIISNMRASTLIAHYCMAGANGWLTKPLAATELAHAVRSASQGHAVLCRQAGGAVLDFLRQVGKSKLFEDLPQRQQEILLCLGANLSNKEISHRLGVSPETVHVQVGRLLGKAGVHSRKQLVEKLLGGGR